MQLLPLCEHDYPKLNLGSLIIMDILKEIDKEFTQELVIFNLIIFSLR